MKIQLCRHERSADGARCVLNVHGNGIPHAYARQLLYVTDEQLKAARAYAEWYIGDPNWADRILAAARAPRLTIEELDRERNEP